MNRILDRIVRYDDRSKLFPITAVVGNDAPFVNNIWECNAWLDQRSEGACVGFAWAHELNATPEVVPATEDLARSIYKRAQQLDIWPGENYDGTSVLGGIKAVQELHNNAGEKYISEYRWAFSIEDLIRTLGHHGPAVLGVRWYSGMFNTDSAGWLRVQGSLAGGHALLAIGVVIVPAQGYEGAPLKTLNTVDLDKSYIMVHNSWGKDWGINGRAKITIRDMMRLLNEQGEACIPVVRVSGPVVTESSQYFAGKNSTVFHDSHNGVSSFREFDSRQTAIDAGFRPCRVCKP